MELLIGGHAMRACLVGQQRRGAIVIARIARRTAFLEAELIFFEDLGELFGRGLGR